MKNLQARPRRRQYPHSSTFRKWGNDDLGSWTNNINIIIMYLAIGRQPDYFTMIYAGCTSPIIMRPVWFEKCTRRKRSEESEPVLFGTQNAFKKVIITRTDQ